MATALTVKPAFSLGLLARPFVVLGDFLIAMGEANSRVQTTRALMAMSDEELAERGLKRDQIVHRVFSESFYV